MEGSTTTGDSARPGGGSPGKPGPDWSLAAQSPELKELVETRRRFTVPVLAFVFVWYFGFIALAGYAPDFMGESIYQGFTVGYLLALSQFVMTWFLGWLYLRKAETVFDPLSERAAKRAAELTSEPSSPAGTSPAGSAPAAEPTTNGGEAS